MIAGIWKTYEEYLSSKEWKDKREWIILNHKNRCDECRMKLGKIWCWKCEDFFTVKGSLQVHHISYEHVGNESAEDVAVLCFVCHKRKHNKSILFTEKFCRCGNTFLERVVS
jgi:5-methylcytosine-specific restriction endonuclease McrA